MESCCHFRFWGSKIFHKLSLFLISCSVMRDTEVKGCIWPEVLIILKQRHVSIKAIQETDSWLRPQSFITTGMRLNYNSLLQIWSICRLKSTVHLESLLCFEHCVLKSSCTETKTSGCSPERVLNLNYFSCTVLLILHSPLKPAA